MPLELRRVMEQHVERSAMLEGDRPLPQAGLLFFQYRGKTKNITSLEFNLQRRGRKRRARPPSVAGGTRHSDPEFSLAGGVRQRRLA